MSLDEKLKQAAIGTILKQQMRNMSTSKERACRNLIDSCMQLKSKNYSPSQIQSFQQELGFLLENSSFTEIKEWLVKRFL